MDSDIRYIITIPIALVYAFFVHLVVNKVININQYDDMCTNKGSFKENNNCWETRQEKEEPLKEKQFLYLIILSLVGIVVGGTISAKGDKKLLNIAIGIALGSIFDLTYTLFSHWYKLKDNFKLIVLGAGLVGLATGSYKFVH